MALKATEVFTPGDYPGHTYVERPDRRLEQKLSEALETPGEIISLSGPSKSGKTVLVERVVGQDNLIVVTGARIAAPDQLWERVLDWMEAPTSTTSTASQQSSASTSLMASGSIGVFGLAQGRAAAKGQVGSQSGGAEAQTFSRRGLEQVVREIANSSYALLIDDYHYMTREVQASVAREIKEAARQGVKIVTASVPHRADDVVRANPELRGRVRAVDLDYWNLDELKRIPELGFPKLGFKIDDESLRQFATEASGSPQLMQAVCLQVCFFLGIREAQAGMINFVLNALQRKTIFDDTSARADFSSLVRNMHVGPKVRGNERKTFRLRDGTTGDVYRCALLAIAADPARLSFPYNELTKRVQRLCDDDTPQGASLSQACAQISDFAAQMFPDQRVVEWSQDDSVLDVVDPYFLFYLRWSNRLVILGQSASPETGH